MLASLGSRTQQEHTKETTDEPYIKVDDCISTMVGGGLRSTAIDERHERW